MPNSTALVVNHENITYNYYRGSDRSYLLAGALFRIGGAAALFSNRCAAIQTDLNLYSQALPIYDVGSRIDCALSCYGCAYDLSTPPYKDVSGHMKAKRSVAREGPCSVKS